jgi:hypothetical protein
MKGISCEWIEISIVLALNQLKSIFPNVDPTCISEALENANGCIESATEALLDDDGTYMWLCCVI